MSINKNIIVVAPHADDETLGCGGSIPRLIDNGFYVHWLLITDMASSVDYSSHQKKNRVEQIDAIKKIYEFASTVELKLPPAELEEIPKSKIISKIKSVFDKISPSIIFLPYRNDVHNDHEIVFDCCIAASKKFRSKYVEKIFCYETLSETEFNMRPGTTSFSPNTFIDISETIKTKIKAMKIYEDQTGEFPFPRSSNAITSLSEFRGVQSGYKHAESFLLLKDTNPLLLG